MPEPSLEAGLTQSNARLLAAISIALGLFVAWVAGQIPGRWYAPPVEAIGTTLLSIGAISILYELFLRRSIQRELLRMVGLQKSLADSHIKGGMEVSRVDWQEVLSHTTEIRCLLIEPGTWITSNWPRVQRVLNERRATFQLLMPDPNARYIAELAARLNIDEGDYRAHLRDAANGIEERWRAAKQTGSLFSDSEIEVRYLTTAPSYSIVLSGSSSVVSIGRSLRRVGREDDFTVTFEGSVMDYPTRWFAEQIRLERDGNIRFSDRMQ